MGNSSVSQILQVTAPRTEAKSPQPNSSQGEEFQQVLARASSGAEQRGPAPADAKEAQQQEEPLADNPERDATASQDDDSSTTADAPVRTASATDEAPLEDSSEELLLDEIELSEAAVLALTSQITTEANYSVEAVTDFDVVTTVFDSKAAENPPQRGDAKPQAADNQFTQTLEVSSSTNQVVASEQVVVDPSAGNSPKQRPTEELPANEFFATSVEEPIAESAEANPVLPQRYQPVSNNSQIAPVKLPKADQTTSEQPGTPSAEEPFIVEGEEQELPGKPTKAAANVESPLVNRDTPVADGAPSKLDQDEAPPKGPVATVSRARGDGLETTARFANSTSGESGAPADAADSDPVSTLDRARFVRRVSRAFQSAHAREGVIQLRLSPPELGSLRIAISSHQGIVSAKVETETAAARNVLLDNLPALRERLAEQQIRLEKFDVDVRRDGGQESSNWEAQDRQPRQPSRNTTGGTQSRQTTATPGRTGRPLGGVADGSLDVRI